MQAYFDERWYLDQACAILGSNSEEASGETKKRPEEKIRLPETPFVDERSLWSVRCSAERLIPVNKL